MNPLFESLITNPAILTTGAIGGTFIAAAKAYELSTGRRDRASKDMASFVVAIHDVMPYRPADVDGFTKTLDTPDDSQADSEALDSQLLTSIDNYVES